MQPKKIAAAQPLIDPSVPTVCAMPSGDGDFLPEVHADRVVLCQAQLFGESMAAKIPAGRDAQMKRQG